MTKERMFVIMYLPPTGLIDLIILKLATLDGELLSNKKRVSAMSIVMHIDANSAFLSWEAVYRLQAGYPTDLRDIPSVVAGDPQKRHGIILARSLPAKKYGIKTAESLLEARNKCPDLFVAGPNYDLYLCCSDAMYEILGQYSPLIQRYSVDECFLDYTGCRDTFGDPETAAYEIKERIKEELGFTVNVGVSSNKLLAKMASELEKPDKVHTLWPDEISRKMWPLPVAELFMVGRATARKLKERNIRTIGDLAGQDPNHMKVFLKSHGLLIWNYANGIDNSLVVPNDEIIQKGIGNSTTIAFDVTERKEALMVLLALTERVCFRLRKFGRVCSLISLSLRTNEFRGCSHQLQLQSYTNSTSEVFKYVVRLFDEIWRGEPVRQLGVNVSGFVKDTMIQLSIFDAEDRGRAEKIDQAVDKIRTRFGDRSITRGCFANGRMDPLQGGVNEGDYIGMGGYK